jgi:hypothetical protein
MFCVAYSKIVCYDEKNSCCCLLLICALAVHDDDDDNKCYKYKAVCGCVVLALFHTQHTKLVR